MSAISQNSALGTQPSVYKYKAFISYKRDPDIRIATALQSALHRIGRPWYKPYAIRVFRDVTDIELSHQAWTTIRRGLEQSEYLILLASPQGALSPWVKKEVQYWVENRSIEKLLIVLVDGVIVWGEQDYDWQKTNSLPLLLHGQYTEMPIYLDLTWARSSEEVSLRQPQFKEAAAELSARLQGKEKADVISEDVRQSRKSRKIAWSALVAMSILTLLAVGLAVLAQRNAAESRASEIRALQNLYVANMNLANKAYGEKNDAQAQELLEELIPEPDLIGTDSDVRGFDWYYLWRQHHQELKTFRDQNSYSVTFSQDGNSLISGRTEQTVQILDIGTGEERNSIGHAAPNNFSTLSPDIKIFASFGANKIITLREIATDKVLHSFTGNAMTNSAMVFSPDSKTFISPSADGKEINLWDVATGSLLSTLRGHQKEVLAAAFSPDGKLLASGSEDTTIKLWDLTTRQLIATLSGHRSNVTKVIFSPDGRTLASGSDDNTIRLWDVFSRKVTTLIKVNTLST